MSNHLLNRSLHCVRWLISAAWLGFALGTSAYGQTLLYKWNFDNATGSGASLTVPPAVIDAADGCDIIVGVTAASAAASAAASSMAFLCVAIV